MTATMSTTASMPTLGRSLSTGALRAAAEMRLTHVPRRATQHSCKLAGYEVPPAQLKPGQVRVERQVYTEEMKLNEETYIEADLPKGSNYMRSHSCCTAPRDYKYQKAVKPGEPLEEGGHRGCAHWMSSSRSTHSFDALKGATYHRQHGPSYQALNPPTCVGGAQVFSQFSEDFGTHGDNPRNKMVPGQYRMPVFKTALTLGTPKGTCHMPGYHGFLPTNTANKHVARVEDGARLRSTDKSNLTAEFHVNLVGYSGHIASNPNNCRGGVKGSTNTEFGRSFRQPPKEKA